MDSTGERRAQTVCLLILAGFALAFAIYVMKPVLMPFVLALFIWIGLKPLIDLQVRRLRMPRALGVLTTLFVGAVILALLAALVSASVAQLAENAEGYKAKLSEMLHGAAAHLPLEKLGIDREAGSVPLVNMSAEAVGRTLKGTTGAVKDIISNGLLVLIFTCFLLFGSGGGEPSSATWREIEAGTRRYIVTKVVVSGVTGVLVGSVLWLLKVELAMVFGLLAFMLNFIPSIGSVIATLLPLPVVVLSPDLGLAAKIMAIAIPGAIQFSVGNVIEPRIMGKSVNLHPVTVLLTLVFWGVLWGIVGMFLATPMTAVAKILLAKNELTAPMARVLEGRFESAPET